MAHALRSRERPDRHQIVRAERGRGAAERRRIAAEAKGLHDVAFATTARALDLCKHPACDEMRICGDCREIMERRPGTLQLLLN